MAMLRVTRALLRHASLTTRDFGRGFEGYVRQLPDHPAFARYVKRYVALLSVPALVPGAPPQKFDALDDLYVESEDALAALRATDDWAKVESSESALFVRDACVSVLIHDAALPPRLPSTGLHLTALIPAGGPYERVVERAVEGRIALVRALLRAPRGADLVVSRQLASY